MPRGAQLRTHPRGATRTREYNRMLRIPMPPLRAFKRQGQPACRRVDPRVTAGSIPRSTMKTLRGAVGGLWALGSMSLVVASCSSADDAPAEVDHGTTGVITNLPAQTWSWVPFSDAYCRDGSTTGLGINTNPASKKLVIFLEEGGACFNATTCGLNESSFSKQDFFELWGPNAPADNLGILNRQDNKNPVKDWNYVYVPYCTGDIHGGNEPRGSVETLGPQMFVGFANISTFLQRIVPTFAGVDQVLLAGSSAGGFGTAVNYPQVARAFGNVPVTLLDDSGPLMDDPYVAACLAQQFVHTWGFDKTMLAECGSHCADPSHYLMDYMKHLLESTPSTPMGLIESTGDNVIAYFYGYGAEGCTSFKWMTADSFEAGLQDMRAQLAGYPNFGTFVFRSTEHTSLKNNQDFDTRSAGGSELTTWMSEMLNGHVSSVGP